MCSPRAAPHVSPPREHCPAFPSCTDSLVERVVSRRTSTARPASWLLDNGRLNLILLGAELLASGLQAQVPIHPPPPSPSQSLSPGLLARVPRWRRPAPALPSSTAGSSSPWRPGASRGTSTCPSSTSRQPTSSLRVKFHPHSCFSCSS